MPRGGNLRATRPWDVTYSLPILLNAICWLQVNLTGLVSAYVSIWESARMSTHTHIHVRRCACLSLQSFSMHQTAPLTRSSVRPKLMKSLAPLISERTNLPFPYSPSLFFSLKHAQFFRKQSSAWSCGISVTTTVYKKKNVPHLITFYLGLQLS